MLRLAILTARGRLGTFVGALLALFASAVLVMAGGMLLEAALRSHPPVERYAAAARRRHRAPERRRRPRRRPRRARPRRAQRSSRSSRPCPACARRSPTCRVPARLGGRATVGARLEQRRPHALRAHRRPRARAARARSSPATRRGSARGCASPRPRAPHASPSSASRGRATPCASAPRSSSTDAEAARLAGHPGRVDAIGILAGPGFDVAAAARRRGRRRGPHRRRARPRPSTPSSRQARTQLIAVAASFGGLAHVHRDLRRGRHDGPGRSSSASTRSRCCARSPRRPARSAA